ncbi:hypothetical protein L842_3024 [Mycobacterium intracellulare MIN_052511_1280]|nr:hypothetical protein L842_3024 [Mycobacterium intracellulare MIN_052511_1280]
MKPKLFCRLRFRICGSDSGNLALDNTGHIIAGRTDATPPK